MMMMFMREYQDSTSQFVPTAELARLRHPRVVQYRSTVGTSLSTVGEHEYRE